MLVSETLGSNVQSVGCELWILYLCMKTLQKYGDMHIVKDS